MRGLVLALRGPLAGCEARARPPGATDWGGSLHELQEAIDTERYSGFVELQNQKVKDAILRAGFNLGDFAKWMRAGKFKGLASVRPLPRVLAGRFGLYDGQPSVARLLGEEKKNVAAFLAANPQ